MKKKPIRTPGDINWRKILKNGELFRRLVGRCVSGIAPLARKLDFEKARFVPTSYIDAASRPLRGDVLWTVPTKSGHSCYIYFLIEHQERPEHLMAARIFRYIAGVYGLILQEDRFAKGGEPLPVVIPIVLYCGDKPWNAPTRFADLLQLPPTCPLCVDSFYFLLDVKALSIRRLRRERDAL